MSLHVCFEALLNLALATKEQCSLSCQAVSNLSNGLIRILEAQINAEMAFHFVPAQSFPPGARNANSDLKLVYSALVTDPRIYRTAPKARSWALPSGHRTTQFVRLLPSPSFASDHHKKGGSA